MLLTDTRKAGARKCQEIQNSMYARMYASRSVIAKVSGYANDAEAALLNGSGTSLPFAHGPHFHPLQSSFRTRSFFFPISIGMAILTRQSPLLQSASAYLATLTSSKVSCKLPVVNCF